MPSVNPDLFQHIFFDLDGTLVDNSTRLYACYKDIISEEGGTPLTKAEYMDMKRSKSCISSILAKSGSKKSPEVFHDQWIDLIETESYLSYDVLKVNAVSALKASKAYTGKLVLITKRRNRDALLRQLAGFGILDLFNEIITPKVKKAEFLKTFGTEKAVVVGDTEEDCEAARSIGAIFVGITTGLRKPELLLSDIAHENAGDIDWPELVRWSHDPVS